MSYFWKPAGTSTEFERQLATESYDPGMGWTLKTKAAQTFGLYTTPGMVAFETRVAEAEKAAGTYNDEQWQVGYTAGEEDPNPHAMTEEAFKAKGYDRNGAIKWTPRMTEQRAQITAEDYDKRQHDNAIMERTSTPMREALGFGAALIASLPDPINLVPVGGQAVRGASIGRRMLAGAKAGAVGTALADAVVLPSARARGEDVGFGTFALDMTFGALIGGGLGAGGHWLHNRRVRSMAPQEEALGKAFTDLGFDAAEASRRAHDVVNVLADTAHRTEKAEAVRSWLGGVDRQDAGRLLDKAMATLVKGQDMDIASWAALLRGHEPVNGESLLPRGVAPGVQKTFAEMLSAVEKEGVPTVNFGALSPDRLAALQAIERAGDMDILRDGQLVLPSNVVWGIFNKGTGVLRGHHTADQLADALIDAIRFDRNAPVPEGGKSLAKSLTKMQDDLIEKGFLTRDKDTGKVGINAETSLGAERKRLIEEMVGAGENRERAESIANLHVAQALAFQKAYGVDAVKALGRRSVHRGMGMGEGEGVRLEQMEEAFGVKPESMQAVRERYYGTDQWMKAPNGKDTNLNEHQWLQVRTPEFKNWFGDWELDPKHASKVVDKNGEPLVLYHGTAAQDNFAVFGTGEPNQTPGWQLDKEAFFFSDKPVIGDSYAAKSTDFRGNPQYNPNSKVYPVFLNIRKPLSVNAKGDSWNNILYKGEDWRTNEFANLAVQKKKDGVVIKNVWDYGPGAIESTADKSNVFVVYDSKQIKSAIGNSGAFDPNNPNILYQRGWHGSPHETFLYFDDNAIGTGEGAQVHGHGHYIAAERRISDNRYRKRLLTRAGVRPRLMVEGVEHTGLERLGLNNSLREDVQRAIDALEAGDPSIGKALSEELASSAEMQGAWAKTVEDVAAWIKARGDAPVSKADITKQFMDALPPVIRNDERSVLGTEAAVDRLWSLTDEHVRENDTRLASDIQKHIEEDAVALRGSADKAKAKSDLVKDLDWDKAVVERDKQGQLYEVEIPEDKDMLWEWARYENQPESIRNALEGLRNGDLAFITVDYKGAQYKRHKLKSGKVYWESLSEKGEGVYKETNPELFERLEELASAPEAKKTYYSLFGSGDTGRKIYETLARRLGSNKAASEALYKAGVKGIVYNGGTDGKAWVVFKGKDIQIVNTFYQQAVEDRMMELFQRAWHGTPYRFDKFTLDHIGEGEGAQAHGWGLYFAQQRMVGEGYRRKLSDGGTVWFADGKEISIADLKKYFSEKEEKRILQYAEDALYDPESNSVDIVAKIKEDIVSVDEFVAEKAPEMRVRGVDEKRIEQLVASQLEYKKQLQELVDKLQREKITASDNKESGQVFEVEIPEDKVLLDEQKPIAEQSEEVRKALESLGIIGDTEKELNSLKAKQKEITSKRQQLLRDRDDLSRDLMKKYGDDFRLNSEKFGDSGKLEAVDRERYNSYLEKVKEIKDSDAEFKSIYDEISQVETRRGTKVADGREAYNVLKRKLGSDKAASLALNEAGVKGITYDGRLDGRCFVVFDEKSIQIVDKLYQAKKQAEAEIPRGMVEMQRAEPGSAEETYRIFLGPNADASTVPHESAHIFHRELENVVTRGGEGANIEQARADLKAIRRYAGVAEEGKLSADDYRKVQEAFARGFEQYLYEGVAPNAALEGVFRRMARWLSSIYEDIKRYVAGTDGVELKDEIRQVYDRMLDPDRWNAGERMDEFRMEGARPDYSKPAPLPEVRPDTVENLERASDDILNEMGHSPIDYEATRLVEQGQASPEHLQQLNEANAALEHVDRVEEASLAAIECIIGAA